MIVDDHSEDRIYGQRYDSRLVRRLLGHVLPHWRLGTVAVAVTVLLAAAQSVVPYLLGLAVDDGVVARDPDALLRVGLFLIGAESLGFGLLFAQQYLLTLAGQRIMLDLRMQLFSHLEAQSLSFFGQHPVGRLVTRIMNDVGTIAALFSTGIIAVLGDVLAILFAGTFLFWLDWRLSLYTFSVLPLIVCVTFFAKVRIRRAFRAIRRLLARLNAVLAENVAGIEIVQIFGRERVNLERFAARNDEHLDAGLRLLHWNGLFSSTVTVLTLGTIALIVWVGGLMTVGGELTLGILVAFMAYARRLFQ
ncbi:ABC transporter ATP-binding protein, partial [Planctomycetota bacterium]